MIARLKGELVLIRLGLKNRVFLALNLNRIEKLERQARCGQ